MRGVRPWLVVLAGGAAALGGLAAGGCSPSDVASAINTLTQDCSVLGETRFVRDTLQDIYLWYQQLPNPDPASFTSPEAYLDAVRYKPLDRNFTFILPRTTSDQLFNDDQYVGLGFPLQVVSSTEARVVEVYPGSPADEAGLGRGAYLLQVNGRAMADLIATGDINTIFGPSQAGVVVHVVFRDMAGAEHDVQMTKRLVNIPNVYLTRTFAAGGRVVGYFAFHDFVNPSSALLDTAFASLQAAGTNDLVIDLRYNGGGLISVAQHLAGLIAGARTQSKVFVTLVFNDKHQSMNQTYTLPNPPQALGLDRLVVITTGGSASASELIINGLRPYMPVTVVGSTTHGKPVGQLTYNFCDKVLYAVAFKSTNAQGQGDYFDGIPPDCAAPDDLDHQLGDGAEASLGAALQYVRTGGCSASAAAQARAQAERRPAVGRAILEGSGWPVLLPR